MKTIRSRSLRFTMTAATALFLAPVAAGAQGDLPDAQSLVDKHIVASGGKAALQRASESVAEGTFSVPGAGLTGTMTTTSAPNRMLVRIEMPGLGTLLSGFDGTTVWGMDPMQGPRVMEGPERDAVLDGTKPGTPLRDSTVISSMQTTARDTIAGVACWRVDVKWKSGRETQDCYSVESGLLHASTATTESPMGSMEVTTVLSDYKEFDGVKIPSKVTQNAASQQMVMTIQNVKIGPVPDDAFEPPAEVKAIVK